MGEKPRFTLVVTSDRYDLGWEAEVLRTVDDMTIDLRSGAAHSEDELIALARDADALLVSSREAVTRRVLAALPRCKVVSRYAVGLDHVDLDAAAELGIVVTHAPDYCTNEVADHTLALLLALNRRIIELDQDLRRGAWTDHAYYTDRVLRGPIPALREQTLGIVGLGRIGRAVARRARPFGLTILAADPYVDAETIRAHGAEPAPLADLLTRADIVSLHCPLTEETRGLIDGPAFEQMKRSAVLINTARGPVVELEAAIAALRSRRIAAAALDVVYPEPLPPDSPLYGLPNVILTPHAAYYSERSKEQVRSDTLREALRVLRGQRPRTVANPAVLERVNLIDAG